MKILSKFKCGIPEMREVLLNGYGWDYHQTIHLALIFFLYLTEKTSNILNLHIFILNFDQIKDF